MPLLLEEIKQKLAERVDEVTLLEIMEIDSRMLVSRFSDLIEDDPDKYLKILEEISPYTEDEDESI
jgi:hypothetical protein